MGQPYNILILTTDEERYPPPYENEDLKKFRATQLPAHRRLHAEGLSLDGHYTASAACCPSRATIYTGQYPTLHGVSQTSGAAKGASDPDMFWLDPNSVPTLGHYFRAGGYDTYYHGKWHISDADIFIPGSKTPVGGYDTQGQGIPPMPELYAAANRLDAFGFNGWIGPEPHGSAQSNCGYNRDPGFADQVVATLDCLEQRQKDGDHTPWLTVASFLNPHDIVLYGLLWKSWGYGFSDNTVPFVPVPPTFGEDLSTKPRCQESYVQTYKYMLLPQPQLETYRQFYYWLHKVVDAHMNRVLKRVLNSSLAENTIIVYTSDHGEQLGAHGRIHQKWYNAYEETVHVPAVFLQPKLFPAGERRQTLTSHIDLVPTLMGLAGIDHEAAAEKLEKTHSEVHRLVGRDLSKWLLNGAPDGELNDPLYFHTTDDVSEGLNQFGVRGNHYEAVEEPNDIDAVIANLDGTLWKYARYTDYSGSTDAVDYELYNLSENPLETINLANDQHTSGPVNNIRKKLDKLLDEQIRQKALTPRYNTPPQ